jgi:hypothetical protein
MARHLQLLKHIESEYEYKLEEDIETQLMGNGESEDDKN